MVLLYASHSQGNGSSTTHQPAWHIALEALVFAVLLLAFSRIVLATTISTAHGPFLAFRRDMGREVYGLQSIGVNLLFQDGFQGHCSGCYLPLCQLTTVDLPGP